MIYRWSRKKRPSDRLSQVCIDAQRFTIEPVPSKPGYFTVTCVCEGPAPMGWRLGTVSTYSAATANRAWELADDLFSVEPPEKRTP